MTPGTKEYRRIMADGYPDRHHWIYWAENGAIQIWAEPTEGKSAFPQEKWIGGIECHRKCASESANHDPCWLLQGPCAHDGSSLQFSEQIAPMLSLSDGAFPSGVQDYVFSAAEQRAELWLGEE